jgi:hypothetical protein
MRTGRPGRSPDTAGRLATPEDFFKSAQDVLNNPPQLRTPAENQFLTRMRGVRAAAQDQALRELAEVTSAEFRTEAENAW